MSGSALDRCFLGKHNILHIKTNKVDSFKNQPFVYLHCPTNYQVRYTTGAVVTTGAGARTVVVLYTGVEYTGVV
jgi:hypothetical protein